MRERQYPSQGPLAAVVLVGFPPQGGGGEDPLTSNPLTSSTPVPAEAMLSPEQTREQGQGGTRGEGSWKRWGSGGAKGGERAWL